MPVLIFHLHKFLLLASSLCYQNTKYNTFPFIIWVDDPDTLFEICFFSLLSVLLYHWSSSIQHKSPWYYVYFGQIIQKGTCLPWGPFLSPSPPYIYNILSWQFLYLVPHPFLTSSPLCVCVWGGAVAQLVERATSIEEIPSSIPAVASLLVGSVSV